MTAAPSANDAAAIVEDVTPSRPPHVAGPVWKSVRVFARIASTLAFDLRVTGAENIPPVGGVLMVANHQSYLDPVLLATRIQRPMSYLAKSELFEHPLFAALIRSLNAYPIKQGRGDKGAIEETVRRLREGHLLNVFPEGTRTLDGGVQSVQRGVALVVRRAGVPIVPAVIEGSFQSWSKGRKVPKPQTIRIHYGPPIDASGMKADAIVTLIETTLRTMHAKLHAEMVADGVVR